MAFFVAGEGANGLKKRLAAWKKYYGVKSTPLFRVIRRPVILSDPAQCQRLIKTIKRETQATGTPAALVVVDTLALCIGESDENSQGEMTKFLKAAESICLATGAAVLILHHPNRQGDARGSTALPSNSDGFLALEGKTSSEVVKLNPSKVRDMGENGGIKLRRVVITLDDMLDSKGKPVTSAVFVPVTKEEESDDDTPENESPKRAKSSAKSNFGGKTAKSPGALSEKEQATWQSLLTLNANSVEGVTDKEWRGHAATHRVSDSTFDRAKNKLQKLGKVNCDARGKPGARFTPKI